MHLEPGLLLSVSMPWLLFVMGAGLFWLSPVPEAAADDHGRPDADRRPGKHIVYRSPMIEAFHGKSGIATGILIDTLGTYLVLSTLGMTIACIYSRGTTTAYSVANGS